MSLKSGESELCFKSRTPSEKFLIDGIVRLGVQIKRIDRAQTGRLLMNLSFVFGGA